MQPTNKEIDKLKRYNNCLKCGIDITDKKGWKYCSQRCSKLYLKAQYKKRNANKVREYNRMHRGLAPDRYFARGSDRKELLKRMPRCQKCNTQIGLQVCHIKPHWAGGTNKLYNFIVLCRVCHAAFDNVTRQFWNMPVDIKVVEIYQASKNDYELVN